MFISILSNINKFYQVYKVTVMVLICFVFPSWITDEFLNDVSATNKINRVLFCFSVR